MKEVTISLPDRAYERLMADAAAGHKSPEQWIVEKLLFEPDPQSAVSESLLAAAMDALGFKRLEEKKAQRLSELLSMRRQRLLSSEETGELSALMAEAEALELESLQRLAATVGR
jgi:hypothetical protein